MEDKNKKSEYNRRYREKRKAMKTEVEQPDLEIATQPVPANKPAKKTIEKSDVEESITLEEYVEALVEQKSMSLRQKKKAPETTNGTSQSYSSLFYLVPLVIPFIKAISDVGMKYITPKKEQSSELGTVSLSQLLPQ